MVVILHLTDLHFGMDKTGLQKDRRDLALKSLIDFVQNLDKNWKPDLICVSGDIGWFGIEKDYIIATDWFANKLLPSLSLRPEDLFFSPGNHDSIRTIARELIARPRQTKNRAEKADSLLSIPLSSEILAPFNDFSKFCSKLGVPSYQLGDFDNYLCGSRTHKGVKIVSLNSAWFCQNDSDQGKLWLGMPQLLHLAIKNQIPALADVSEFAEPIIVMFHHPRGWFAYEEEMVVGERINTFDFLSRRSDVILTGHTHGEVRYSDRFAERAYHLSGGATYAGESYRNSIRLIRIKNNLVDYQSFEFDPTAPDSPWLLKKSGGPLILERGVYEPDISFYSFTFQFGTDLGDETPFDSIRSWLSDLAQQCGLECREKSADSVTINSTLIEGDGDVATLTVTRSPDDPNERVTVNVQVSSYIKMDDLILNSDRPVRHLEYQLANRINLAKFDEQAKIATGSTFKNGAREDNGIEITTRLTTSLGMEAGGVLTANIEHRPQASVITLGFTGPANMGLKLAHRFLTPGVILNVFQGHINPIKKRNLLLTALGVKQ